MTPSGRAPGAYRADVDGMRALAVLFVIANHFNPGMAPGGFVGVDVFFVISGFVVTGSILYSASGDAWSDLVQFWRRRFFRIFPVLLLFVAATLLAISVFTAPYPPVPYNGNIRAGLFSLVGLSNIYIYRIGLDYFQDGPQNVFIHTWSLGVEEQFYVLYSLLFIAVPRLLPVRDVARLRGAGLLCLGALSLALFLHGVRATPMQTYYFLPPRFWELAIGALIALLPQPLMQGGRWPSLVIGAQVGAAILLAAVVFIAPDPAGAPLLRIPVAVAATALLISTGARRGAVAGAVLAVRPVVFVGLISYSLYLWHWPVLLIFRSTVGLEHPLTVVLALVLMTALAVASWRFVERPWRRPRHAVLIVPYAGVLAAAVAGLAFTATLKPGRLYAGHPQDWTRDWMPEAGFAWLGGGRVTARDCMLSNGSTPPSSVPSNCTSPPALDNRPKVLLIGDSLAAANWPMVAVGERQGAFRISTLAHSGCSIEESPAVQAASCAEYWKQAPALVRESVSAGDLVFIATLWSGPDASPSSEAPQRIVAIAEAARAVGATTAVQAPLPHFGRTAYTCTREWFRSDYAGCSAARSSFDPQRKRVLQMLQQMQRAEPNLRVWDPFPRLCPGKTCTQFIDERPLFRDYTHLSAYGAGRLGPDFVAFLAARDRHATAPLALSGGVGVNTIDGERRRRRPDEDSLLGPGRDQ